MLFSSLNVFTIITTCMWRSSQILAEKVARQKQCENYERRPKTTYATILAVHTLQELR